MNKPTVKKIINEAMTSRFINQEENSIRWILQTWLIDNNYDGLVLEEEQCGCTNEDLICCYGQQCNISRCKAAYIGKGGRLYPSKREAKRSCYSE